jgi:hypothetical protein
MCAGPKLSESFALLVGELSLEIWFNTEAQFHSIVENEFSIGPTFVIPKLTEQRLTFELYRCAGCRNSARAAVCDERLKLLNVLVPRKVQFCLFIEGMAH